MELYGLDEDVAQHEAMLAALSGPDRLAALVPLAWYLRQRDSARALALAAEGSGWLDAAGDGAEVARHRARLGLVRSEIAILQGRYDEAQAALADAMAAFAVLDDPIGLGDAELIGFLLHQVQGVVALALGCAERARGHYSIGADDLRRRAAQSWSLLLMAYGDIDAAEAQLDGWDGALPGDDASSGAGAYAQEHPAVACVLLSAKAVIHSARNESAQAMLCAARAAQRGELAGLVRQAIACADNAGWYLQELGDLDAAAEWMDKEYAAARATGWPAVLAFSATRFGELLRHLGQFERSREVLREAIALYDQIPGGINKGVAYRVWGKTLLALDQAEEALDAFDIATRLFRAEQYHERLANALIGAALSLSAAGRPDEALDRIEEARALSAAHCIRKTEIELARALAEIHARHLLPPPEAMQSPTATVHYLEQELSIGTALESWQPPVDLLTGLSAAWEQAGDGPRALAYLKQAMTAERREGHRKAANRTLALQIRHETEQARLETLHSRALAAAEAERVAALEAALAEARALQLELERRRAEFERLSLLDALTGVGNRRHFNERGLAEIARSRRDGAPLGVAILDIDHFKQVNDRFGHAIGDTVLREIAEATRSLLRPSDFIARLGGEEFALLIPGADLKDLFALAERIRGDIEHRSIPTEAGVVSVTVSFGLALLTANDASIEAVVSRADAGLYQAKHDGRNRTVAHGSGRP